MDFDQLLEKLLRLNTVSLRVEKGQSLVDEISDIGLNVRQGRLPDNEETRCVSDIATNWIGSSNNRVSLQGIDLLSVIVGYMGIKFRALLTKCDVQLIAKMGDQQIQDPAIQMFLNIFRAAYDGPEALAMERILKQAWGHKVWRVREGGCHLLRHTLDKFPTKAKEVGFSKLVGDLLRLIDDDKQVDVRESGIEAMCAGYRCFGNRLKCDLTKRNPKRLYNILAKMDEVIIDPSIISSNKTPSRPSSRPGSRTPSASGRRVGTATLSRMRPTASGDSEKLGAGEVGVPELEREYNEGLPDPDRLDFSPRGIDRIVESITSNLTASSTDWEVRIKELKMLRLLGIERILAGFAGTELRKLAPSLNTALNDLRSQVTREACVTIGSMAQNLSTVNFGSLVNLIMPNLLKLIPNSAKIMSSSAVSCVHVIIRDCPYHKLVPHITEQVRDSKSVIVRKKCTLMLCLVIKSKNWSVDELKKVLDELRTAICKSLQDSDSAVRQYSRDMFHYFSDKFPVEASSIKASMPSNVQKLLNANSLKRSDSQDSIASTGSVASSRGSINRIASSLGSRSGARTPKTPTLGSRTRSDLGPVNAKFSTMNPYTKPSTPSNKYKNVQSRYSQKNLGTPPVRTISQPGSRSNSPPHSLTGSTTRRTPSRIPRHGSRSASRTGSRQGSRAGSREGSPDSIYYDRKMLPSGAAGQRLLSNLLGVQSDINPSHAISQLIGATTNADRKQALATIETMCEQRLSLNKTDMRRLVDIIQKMINGSAGSDKIISHVFRVIPKILSSHANSEPVKEWLYVLLLGILKRLGSLLGQERNAALEVLDAIKREFPKELIYSRIRKFLVDPGVTQPTYGQKAATLRFLRELISYLDSTVLTNCSETRLVMSKLVGWSCEQKSAEVRREAAAAIQALFALNPAQFSAALNDLPKTFQDGATKVLREQSPVSQSSFSSSSASTLPNPKISSNKSYERKSSHGTLSPNQHLRTTERYYTPERTSERASPAPSSVKDEIRNISEQITMMNFTGEIDDDNEFLIAEKALQELDSTVQCEPGVLGPTDLLNRPGSTNKPNPILESLHLLQQCDADSIKMGLKTIRDVLRENSSEFDDKLINRTLTQLVEVAESRDNSMENRLASVHCIRDLALNKGNALTPDSVETSVKKIIVIKADVESTAGVKQADSLPRSLATAATSLLETVTIWKCFGILAPGIADVNPINRDSIDIARQVVEGKKMELANQNASTIEDKQANMLFFNNLIAQWTNETPAVRKAVVYCLVHIYTARRDIVEPYLAGVSGTNRKLFDLYLNKHTS